MTDIAIALEPGAQQNAWDQAREHGGPLELVVQAATWRDSYDAWPKVGRGDKVYISRDDQVIGWVRLVAYEAETLRWLSQFRVTFCPAELQPPPEAWRFWHFPRSWRYVRSGAFASRRRKERRIEEAEGLSDSVVVMIRTSAPHFGGIAMGPELAR